VSSWVNATLGRSAFDGIAPFADPYVDIASQVVPTSVAAMLRHAEWLAVAGDGILRECYNRISAYFVTRVEIEGDLGDDEKENQERYLEDELGINGFMVEHGLSGLVYGVRYLSVFKPFTRYVACPRCKANYRFIEFAQNRRVHDFSWTDGKVNGKCPACRYAGDFGTPVDTEDESRPLILRSWNPHDIRIVWVEATGQVGAFDWVIPADFRTEVKLGHNLQALADTPWPWLQAAVHDQNVQLSPELVRYWREPALAGLRFRGVGVPRAIVNMRRLYYTQILLRMNEVLAIGHVVPMRVVSPANTAGRSGDDSTDILRIANLGDLRTQFMRMTALHRADPNSIHYSPVPLQMQALGADARQLIPADLMNQAIEMELNASGVPIDLFRMTLTQQAAPVALRLFARYWAPFVDGLNMDLAFIARRTQYLKRWESARYKLADNQIVDDIERRQLEVQMAQAGLLAQGHILKQFGTNKRLETRQKLEDLRTEREEQDRFQQQDDAFTFSRQLAQAQGGAPGQGGAPPGGAPPGGAPAGPSGGSPGAPSGGGAQPPAGAAPPGTDPLAGLVPQPGQKIDPAAMYSQAQTAADTLLRMSDGERFSKLQEIKEVNPPFHGLVKQLLEESRSKARSQGQRIVMNQNYGQGGGSPGQ
jgi:hypothetical protein